MQFPESWLREFCNPPLTTKQIADVLTMGGLEVEVRDGVARLVEGDSIAGSTLTMAAALAYAVDVVGVDLADAARMA